MKKWHMEGIVDISGVHRQKLVVPNMRSVGLLSTAAWRQPRKELGVVRFFRYWVGLFLRYF